MGIYQTVDHDCKTAMKEKDALRVSVLRMLIAAVKMHEIQKNIKEVSDADVIQIIRKQIKQRKESIAQFTQGARQDLAEKETAELKILERYVPAELGPAELDVIVRSVIAETGASSKADTGKVMKAVMERVQGRADGKVVNQAVSRLLP